MEVKRRLATVVAIEVLTTEGGVCGPVRQREGVQLENLWRLFRDGGARRFVKDQYSTMLSWGKSARAGTIISPSEVTVTIYRK